MSKLYVATAANLVAARVASGGGMFTAPASADGTEPATHCVSYGITSAEVEAAIAPHSTSYEGEPDAALSAAGVVLIDPIDVP